MTPHFGIVYLGANLGIPIAGLGSQWRDWLLRGLKAEDAVKGVVGPGRRGIIVAKECW